MDQKVSTAEAVFDCLYLVTVLGLSLVLLLDNRTFPVRMAGFMALILFCGDTFHLFPRILVASGSKKSSLTYFMELGKQVSSVTMTIFYLFLWNIGLILFRYSAFPFYTIIVYALALIRLILCIMPQNNWNIKKTDDNLSDKKNDVSKIQWAIYRNLPFLLLVILVATFFYQNRFFIHALSFLWVAIILSFLFYIPVVLGASKWPKLGILMIPKSLMYIWMISMFLQV